MTEITNYNCHEECADICMEKYCSELATHYLIQRIGNYEFLIPMCEKHYDKTWRLKLIGE